MHPLKSLLFGGSAGAEGARPKFELSLRGLARGRRGGKTERTRNGCSGVKKFPRCQVGGRLTGKQGGRDKAKTFCPGGVLKGKTWNNN